MNRATLRRPRRVYPARVGADLHPRLLKLHAHIVFGHHKIHAADALSLGGEEVYRGIEPVRTSVGGDCGECLPVVVVQLRAFQPHRHNAVRPRKCAHCLPCAIRMQRGFTDRGAGGRIAQVLIELAIGGGPGRQHRRKPRSPRNVWVHIRRHVSPRCPCRRDRRYCRCHLSPVRLPRRLEVIHLYRHVCTLANLQRFRQPFEELICLRAQMRDVDTTIPRDDRAYVHQFLGAHVGIGWVDKGIRDAERAVLHRFRHHAAHRFALIGVGIAHCHALRVLPQGAAAEEAADVWRDAMLRHRLQPVAETCPCTDTLAPIRQPGEKEAPTHGVIDLAAKRRGRPRLAHDLGGNALGDLREAVRVLHQGNDAVRLNINEAGADNVACRVHYLGGIRGIELARRSNRADAVALYRHVTVKPRTARAVYHACIADQDIHCAPPTVAIYDLSCTDGSRA